MAITNNPVTANPGMSRTWTRPLSLGGALKLHTKGSNLSYSKTTIRCAICLAQFLVLRDIVTIQRQHGCGGLINILEFIFQALRT